MNTRNVWLMLVDVKFFNLDKKIMITSSDVGIVIIIFSSTVITYAFF